MQHNEQPSILDSDPEAVAILELVGKGRKSEGLRDQDPMADIPDVKDLPPMQMCTPDIDMCY